MDRQPFFIPESVMAVLATATTALCVYSWWRHREPWMLPLSIGAFWQTIYYVVVASNPSGFDANIRAALYRPSIVIMYMSLIAHGLRDHIEHLFRTIRRGLGR